MAKKIMTYDYFVQKVNELGYNFSPKEFTFALMIAMGFQRVDAAAMYRDMSHLSQEEINKKKNVLYQAGSAQLAKGQIKELLSLLEESIEDICNKYLADNKIIEKKLLEHKIRNDKEDVLLSEVSKMTVNVDTLNEMAIMVFRELKRRDISEFDTKEFKDIMEILAKCTKQLDTSDPTQDKIDKAIVTVYPPFNVFCPHCSRECYAAPELVTRCQNCNELIDCRPAHKKDEELAIYELPKELQNYWSRNYSDEN